MKLYKSLLIFVFTLLLGGCGESEATVEETTVESETEEIVEETMEIDSEQPLENVGEYKYNIQGRVELLDIIRPRETFKLLDGVDINFRDIKVLYHSEIPENEKAFFREVYGFDEEGYSVQFSYSATNNTNETIGGIEILDIVTSNGSQYNIYNDGAAIDGSAYEVRPDATANVGVIFTVEDPNINYLDLYFQPLDKEGYNLDETKIKIDF